MAPTKQIFPEKAAYDELQASQLPYYYLEHKINCFFVTLSEAKGLGSSAPSGPQNDNKCK